MRRASAAGRRTHPAGARAGSRTGDSSPVGEHRTSGRAASQSNPQNKQLLAYSHVMLCHAWALKHWALGKRYSLDQHVREGLQLLVESFLTEKGRAQEAIEP